MRTRIVGVFLIGLALIAGACGPASPKTALVKILSHEGNDFWRPNTVQVSVGGTVIWQNNGGVDRSIISDQGLFDQTLSPGEDFQYTFKQAGTFTYHDNPNTETDTVIVK